MWGQIYPLLRPGFTIHGLTAWQMAHSAGIYTRDSGAAVFSKTKERLHAAPLSQYSLRQLFSISII
jgi:hypothetical protein